MSEAGQAVFLSYASQDAEAAKRIAEALRAAGVEVWFDQSELVGGDAWDQKIRQQISDCALFVPVISANTQARREGYFRLEWKLAAQRTHMMSDDTPFLLPVVIDETRDAEARVPAEFKAVQWTRLHRGCGGQARPEAGRESAEVTLDEAGLAAFCTRVAKLLASGAAVEAMPAAEARPAAAPAKASRASWTRYGWAAVGIGFALVFAFRPLWQETARGKQAASAERSASLPETQKLERQARALIDSEPLAVRETLRTAYQLCEKAAALSPGEADVWATMARANVVLIGLYQEGGTERAAAARSQAEKALSLAPDSVEAGLAMAAVELELLAAEPLAVRARLEELLKKAPGDHRILLLLAETEDGDTVSETAFRWLARAEAIPAGKAAAALRQAWIFWGANRLRESLEAVERSLAAQPLSEAYHLKLMLLETTGETEAAQAWLKRIPSVVLREDRAAMIAYETLYFARKPEEALRVLQTLPREVLEEGRFFDVRALLAAEALLMAGKANAAEVELRAAMKVIDERLATNPRHGRLWHCRGRAQVHLGDRAGAERSFSTAAELGGLRKIELAAQMILLGRNEDTLAFMDKALDRRLTRWPSWLHYFKLHPVFDPLQADPRYHQLLARAEAWLAEDLRRSPTGAPGIADTSVSATAEAKVNDKSVAVLAFANLSDDKANEYFSDGISEELLNVLAKVPGLKVSARTSAFYFKGKEVPVPEIARQLGVAYVVEGSVRKQGDKVRITAQLIKAADGFHVWSDTFTRDLKDVFAVQDEIAGLIAKNLQLKLGAGNERESIRPEIYELLLQARALARRESTEGRKQAIALYRQALATEPRLAAAWAEMAHAYVALGRFGGLPITESMREARAAAQEALALDPDQPAGLGALALVQRTADWDWRGAQRSIQRAMQLAPGDAGIMSDAAVLFFNVGRVEEAIALARRAVERDPLNVSAQFYLGAILGIDGRFEESLRPLTKAVELAPAADEYHTHVARTLIRLGRLAEAEKMIELEPNEAYRLVGLAQLRHAQGDLAGAAKSRDELIAKFGDEIPGYVALTCADLEDKEQAFAWLARAAARRDSAVVWIKTNYYLRSLHGDPRWSEFLRKLGLADDQLQ